MIPCQPSGQRVIPSGRPAVQSFSCPDDVSYHPDTHQTKSIIRPNDVDSRPDLPLCQEASNGSNLHPFGRFSSPSERLSVFDQASNFLFQNQIWEDYCNRPGDVDSRPDALPLKASSQFKFNRLDASLPRSERVYDRYENCVQQITSSDGHCPGPNVRSLYNKITCSGRATVRTTVSHRLDAALKQKRSSVKFLEFQSQSCPS